MKKAAGIVRAGLAAFVFSTLFSIAVAAEIKVLNSLGMREVMDDLGPKFERATGHKLAITSATLGATVKRVQSGETADVVIIAQQGIDSFVKDGKVAANSATVVARSGMGVAVRMGAPRPAFSSPESFKRMLLNAKSIAYVNPASGGASGIHFAKVLDRLGIANEMKSKTVFPNPKTPTDVGALVANGEAEIAVHTYNALIQVAGIEIVGPLPGDLQDTTVFAAATMAGSKEAAASKALVDFLRTPEAVKVIKAKGMEPG